LLDSQARSAAILDNAPDTIVTMDHDGLIVEFNPAAERLFGYSRADVLGKNLSETIIPPELRDAHRLGLARYLATGDGPVLDQRIDIQAMRADQTQLPVEMTIICLPVSGPPLFTGFIRDMTERERSQATQRHLAAIVECTDDAIIGKTVDGIVTSWNPGAERLYGYTADEIIGQPISVIYPVDRMDEFATLQAGLRRGERLAQSETVRSTRDGRRIEVSISVSPLVDASGRVVGGASIDRDISERKRAEAAILALNADLEQRVVERTTELEAAVTDMEAFSYSVSHDLRAPLRAVTGFSRILLQEHASELTPEGQSHLQTICTSGQHMGQLIDDLLAFSRLGRQLLRKQRVLPDDIVRGALAELTAEQEGRTVELVIGELLPCEADPALLRQVFVNLLANALKFTRQRPVAHIEVGSAQTDDQVLYFVKDDGTGFNMKYADKLFGVFQRLHKAEDYEGTGVGLAIVQRIIHRHDGKVWGEAVPDEGATFFFTLPRVRAERLANSTVALEEGDHDGSRKTAA
jgi:PAS domain S-box-containing protein